MRTSLQKGEKILLITHASWTSLIIPVFIALVGFVGSYFIGFIQNYGWIAAVLGLLYLLIRYAAWRANIWVVTNFRVIDEVGLINHFAKESPLDKINNVSYSRTVMGRIFNYGDVEIQTAAQVGATTYVNVNHPKRLQETIAAAQSEYKNWEYGNQAKQMAAAMDTRGAAASAPQVAAELEKLFELKMKGAISEEEYNRAKARLLNH
ncbi:PH domain-containing protein [Puia sp. P3]|uniref:SHOCT domain-containing protein n=1 Tax=Puia sp. P3 TaxID=3423952 RepID=UPI003D675927